MDPSDKLTFTSFNRTPTVLLYCSNYWNSWLLIWFCEEFYKNDSVEQWQKKVAQTATYVKYFIIYGNSSHDVRNKISSIDLQLHSNLILGIKFWIRAWEIVYYLLLLREALQHSTDNLFPCRWYHQCSGYSIENCRLQIFGVNLHGRVWSCRLRRQYIQLNGEMAHCMLQCMCFSKAFKWVFQAFVFSTIAHHLSTF